MYIKTKRIKDAMCCFEQNLEAAPYKTVVVRPLITHLADQVRWANHVWLFGRNKNEFINVVPT